MQIDLIASQPHYLNHLLAVHNQLPHDLRGGLNRYAKPHSVTPMRREIALCAGWVDARTARQLRYQRVVLMEHGCGQSYQGESDGRRGNPHYVGGAERSQVLDLVLLPNQMAADVEATYNPKLPAVVVGSPWLDTVRIPGLHQGERSGRASVAFHWDCPDGVAPEAGSAFQEYRGEVAKLPGVLTHTHPRADGHRRWYQQRGLDWRKDLYEAIACSPVFVSDNSSALYYAAALGRDMVVVNSKRWSLNIHHGLRFWSHAAVGEMVWDPKELGPAVERASEWTRNNRDQRQRILDEVFPYRGQAAQRAADVLQSFAALWTEHPQTGLSRPGLID